MLCLLKILFCNIIKFYRISWNHLYTSLFSIKIIYAEVNVFHSQTWFYKFATYICSDIYICPFPLATISLFSISMVCFCFVEMLYIFAIVKFLYGYVILLPYFSLNKLLKFSSKFILTPVFNYMNISISCSKISVSQNTTVKVFVFASLYVWARASPGYVLTRRVARFLALIDVPYLCLYNNSSRWVHEFHFSGFTCLLANKSWCWNLAEVWLTPALNLLPQTCCFIY